MKRFITVAKQHAGEVAILLRNGAATAAGAAAANDAYQWLKQHLSHKGLPHNDQQASHQSQLPHQGGYVSFFVDPNGRWTQVEH